VTFTTLIAKNYNDMFSFVKVMYKIRLVCWSLFFLGDGVLKYNVICILVYPLSLLTTTISQKLFYC